ncbi:hypothetical protein LEP1GSC059_1401 [Leptospira noguchii serovar Panama str. CZ214]|uniref:Uncharacterized protein n=1 Tax=Leptospira noguchii serovar Panama str. CZ214 TaxID=1001595 RepID=T0GSU7_9LEPT|nr:hypothetical protein LEP1GSC059_1401 [Leptospira noguchii serovar Panama str. CZ214]
MFIAKITNVLRRRLIFFYHTSYGSRLIVVVRIFQSFIKK